MFQKPAFLDWNDETNERYLTLGGFPVYTHEEPSYLGRAFRRARDFVKLPEIHCPLIAFAAAAYIDYGSDPNFDFMLSGAVIISLWGGMSMKYMEAVMHIPTDLSPMPVARPYPLRKPYYFDKEPEGALNSEKPQQFGAFDTLKTRAAANAIINGAMGTAFAAIPFSEEVFSASSFAISSVYAAPLLTNAFRYTQVVRDKWDLTDEPTKPKKKPEKAPASSVPSKVLAYQPI